MRSENRRKNYRQLNKQWRQNQQKIPTRQLKTVKQKQTIRMVVKQQKKKARINQTRAQT